MRIAAALALAALTACTNPDFSLGARVSSTGKVSTSATASSSHVAITVGG